MVVTVEKATNSKPMPNTAVVFRAVRNGEDDGNLEMKTDPDGRASIDLLAKLAAAFGVEPAELLRQTDQMDGVTGSKR